MRGAWLLVGHAATRSCWSSISSDRRRPTGTGPGDHEVARRPATRFPAITSRRGADDAVKRDDRAGVGGHHAGAARPSSVFGPCARRRRPGERPRRRSEAAPERSRRWSSVCLPLCSERESRAYDETP